MKKGGAPGGASSKEWGFGVFRWWGYLRLVVFAFLFIPVLWVDGAHGAEDYPRLFQAEHSDLLLRTLVSVLKRATYLKVDEQGVSGRRFVWREVRAAVKSGLGEGYEPLIIGGLPRGALGYIYFHILAKYREDAQGFCLERELQLLRDQHEPIPIGDLVGLLSDVDVAVRRTRGEGAVAPEALISVGSHLSHTSAHVEPPNGEYGNMDYALRHFSQKFEVVDEVAQFQRAFSHLGRSFDHLAVSLDSEQIVRPQGMPDDEDPWRDVMEGRLTITSLERDEWSPDDLPRVLRGLEDLPYARVHDPRGALARAIEGQHQSGRDTPAAKRQREKFIAALREGQILTSLRQRGGVEAKLVSLLEIQAPLPAYLPSRPRSQPGRSSVDLTPVLVSEKEFLEQHTDNGVVYHTVRTFEYLLKARRTGFVETAEGTFGTGLYATAQREYSLRYGQSGDGGLIELKPRVRSSKPMKIVRSYGALSNSLFSEDEMFRQRLRVDMDRLGYSNLNVYLREVHGVDAVVSPGAGYEVVFLHAEAFTVEGSLEGIFQRLLREAASSLITSLNVESNLHDLVRYYPVFSAIRGSQATEKLFLDLLDHASGIKPQENSTLRVVPIHVQGLIAVGIRSSSGPLQRWLKQLLREQVSLWTDGVLRGGSFYEMASILRVLDLDWNLPENQSLVRRLAQALTLGSLWNLIALLHSEPGLSPFSQLMQLVQDRLAAGGPEVSNFERFVIVDEDLIFLLPLETVVRAIREGTVDRRVFELSHYEPPWRRRDNIPFTSPQLLRLLDLFEMDALGVDDPLRKFQSSLFFLLEDINFAYPDLRGQWQRILERAEGRGFLGSSPPPVSRERLPIQTPSHRAVESGSMQPWSPCQQVVSMFESYLRSGRRELDRESFRDCGQSSSQALDIPWSLMSQVLRSRAGGEFVVANSRFPGWQRYFEQFQQELWALFRENNLSSDVLQMVAFVLYRLGEESDEVLESLILGGSQTGDTSSFVRVRFSYREQLASGATVFVERPLPARVTVLQFLRELLRRGGSWPNLEGIRPETEEEWQAFDTLWSELNSVQKFQSMDAILLSSRSLEPYVNQMEAKELGGYSIPTLQTVSLSSSEVRRFEIRSQEFLRRLAASFERLPHRQRIREFCGSLLGAVEDADP